MTLRAIDLCCGAGGWAVAARGLPIRITHAWDLWEDAATTYRLNHPGTAVHVADLTHGLTVDPGRVDIVLGGIPCQWLSPARGKNGAGARERLRERRLLRACLRLIDELKPRWWCFEDVVQLRRELPRRVPVRVINSRDSGYSVQNRRRLYAGVFPEPLPPEHPPRPLSELLDRGPHRICRQSQSATLVQVRNARNPKDVKSAVDVHGDRFPTVCGEWCLRHQNTTPVLVDNALPGGRRSVSITEAARIQGFPADYVFVGSQTSMARMIGNAVQIDTARAILRGICREAGLF